MVKNDLGEGCQVTRQIESNLSREAGMFSAHELMESLAPPLF